jgi:heme-degrading monooxygenase HmoA
MIARTWHGIVPAEKADEYYEFLQKSGIHDYKATEGNRGVFVLRRIEGDVCHFLLVTLWESMEAIKRFAGDKPELAHYYPEDKAFLLEFEEFVTHYDALFTEFK